MINEYVFRNIIELSERCDYEVIHNLQVLYISQVLYESGQLLASANTVRENFNLYFNQEGSIA